VGSQRLTAWAMARPGSYASLNFKDLNTDGPHFTKFRSPELW
jgi:hypothetical protein